MKKTNLLFIFLIYPGNYGFAQHQVGNPVGESVLLAQSCLSGNEINFSLEGNTFNTAESFLNSIEKEEPIDLSKYGKGFSVGLSCGSGAMFGIPVRYYPGKRIALELGTYHRAIFISGSFPYNFRSSLALLGGPTVMIMKQHNQKRQKVCLNGLFLKGGYAFSSIGNESIVLFGWAYEGFSVASDRHSFMFELGVEYVHQNFKYPYEDEVYDFPVLLYWKCQFNLFLQ